MSVTYTQISGTHSGTIELAATFSTDTSQWGSGTALVTVRLYIKSPDDNEPAKTQQFSVSTTNTSTNVNVQAYGAGISGTLILQDGVITMQGLNACNPGHVQILSPNVVVAII